MFDIENGVNIFFSCQNKMSETAEYFRMYLWIPYFPISAKLRENRRKSHLKIYIQCAFEINIFIRITISIAKQYYFPMKLLEMLSIYMFSFHKLERFNNAAF